MKNALLLLSIWVGILVAAYAMVYWDLGADVPLPASVREPSDWAYVDAEGRFSLSVPASWDLEETGSSIVLSDPAGAVEVTILTVEEAVPEAALLSALGILSADEESGTITVTQIASVGESERAVRIGGPAGAGEASYGLAYLYEGQTIVLVVRGSEEGLGERAAELNRIQAGISIPAASGGAGTPAEVDAPVVEL